MHINSAEIMMTTKRLCVVTMVGGFDLIGDLCEDTGLIERPFTIHRQGSNLALSDMMKNGVFSGDYIRLNMDNVIWTGTPSEAIAKAYKATRSGLVLQGTMPPAAVNQ